MKVLDTYALVGFFKGEEFAPKVNDILRSMEDGRIKVSISALTISELFYILSRFKDADFAKTIIRYIKISDIDIIPVSEEVAEKAGEFKFKYSKNLPRGLPIADAIIAATAWKEKAVVVSSSEHFGKIEEIEVEHI
jgi:predicted nucleic acid-binding protein